ncbi:MAG: helix-turn-helix transcriptional regulator [Quinella sp. 1Q5]|nr:helix-turn-helix transcriptional regulator [Quinella sp. 1Q5]
MLEPNTEKLYQTIGRNIYKFRVLKQLSQAKLAERSNVSAAYISQIECARLHKGITCTAIMKIAETLQVPACVLLAEETCPKYLQCLETIKFFEEEIK